VREGGREGGREGRPKDQETEEGGGGQVPKGGKARKESNSKRGREEGREEGREGR
jgi:hypothetical protein